MVTVVNDMMREALGVSKVVVMYEMEFLFLLNSKVEKYINILCLFFPDVIKGEKMNPVFDEPPNPTNVEETLQRVKSNDSSLTEVNLNNIKVRHANRNTNCRESIYCMSIFGPMAVSWGFFFPEHSNSHAEGLGQSHGEEHARQEVQLGSNTE